MGRERGIFCCFLIAVHIAAGCKHAEMMQEKEEVDRIREKYPFVNLVFGTHNLFRFAQLLTAALIERSEYMKALAEAAPGENRKGKKVTRRQVIGGNSGMNKDIISDRKHRRQIP